MKYCLLYYYILLINYVNMVSDFRSCTLTHDWYFLENFLIFEIFKFLEKSFFIQFQVVYKPMTIAYINMTFKITKSINENNFCEWNVVKRAKNCFN